MYDKGDQRFSWPAKVAAAGIPSAAVAGALLAGVPSVPWLGWLEYLNALALVKLGITLVKYVPQVCFTPPYSTSPLYPLAVFSPILLVLSLSPGVRPQVASLPGVEASACHSLRASDSATPLPPSSIVCPLAG